MPFDLERLIGLDVENADSMRGFFTSAFGG